MWRRTLFLENIRKRFEGPATFFRRASSQKTSNAEYCMDIVRKFDYENFLCTLLLPEEARITALAVRAFNVEVSQIRDTVSERQIGAMRMQFWRDTLEQIYKEIPPHTPIAFELAKALRRHKLSKRWFTRILQSREENLSDSAFKNISEVEEYSENTSSSIHYLVLESLGIQDVHADHVASHIGKAQGLVTLIRAAPFNANKRRVYLPVDLMIKHNVSQEDVVRGCDDQRMKDLVFDIASIAKQHVDKSRSLKKDVPKQARLAFLPLVPCESYLKQIQLADFNVFDPRLQHRNHWLPLKLLIHKLKGTY